MLRAAFVNIFRAVLWVLGLPLSVIGIAGLSEDLQTWARWIDAVVNDPLVQHLAAKAVALAAFVNRGWVRIALTVLGAALCLSPVVWFWRARRAMQTAPSRVFVPSQVSLADLAEPFRTRTRLEARDSTARYLGCWLKVRGCVSQLSRAGPDAVLVVYAEHFFLGPLAHMYFRGDHAAKAALLRKGSPFKAIGRIAAVDHSGVTLEDCELEG